MSISGSATWGYDSGPMQGQVSTEGGESVGISTGTFTSELGEEGADGQVEFGPSFLGLEIPSSGSFEMSISAGVNQAFDLGIFGTLTFQSKVEVPQITIDFSGEIEKAFKLPSTGSGTLTQESGKYSFSQEHEAYESAGIYVPGLVWRGMAYKLDAELEIDLEVSRESTDSDSVDGQNPAEEVKVTAKGNITLSLRPVFGIVDDPPPIPPFPYHPFQDPPDDQKQDCREKTRVYDDAKDKLNEITNLIHDLLKSIEQDQKDIAEATSLLDSEISLLAQKTAELDDLIAKINQTTGELNAAQFTAEAAEATAAAALTAAASADAAAVAATAAAAAFLGTNPIFDGLAITADSAAVTATATATAAAGVAAAAEATVAGLQQSLTSLNQSKAQAENEKAAIESNITDYQQKQVDSNAKLTSDAEQLNELQKTLDQIRADAQSDMELMSKVCIMRTY